MCIRDSARTARTAISTSRATPAKPPTNTAPQIEAADLAYSLRDATEDGASARLSDAIYETFRCLLYTSRCV